MKVFHSGSAHRRQGNHKEIIFIGPLTSDPGAGLGAIAALGDAGTKH